MRPTESGVKPQRAGAPLPHHCFRTPALVTGLLGYEPSTLVRWCLQGPSASAEDARGMS